MNDSLIFKEAFKKALEINGLKLKDVAARLEITPSSLSPYLNGKIDPGLKLMNKVASAFGLNLVDFLNLASCEDNQLTQDAPSPALPRPGEPGDWPQIKAEYDTIKALLAGQIKATHEQTSALGEIIAAAIKSVRDEERDKMLAERETRIKQLENDIEELKEDRDRLRTKVEGNILALVRRRGDGRKNAA